MEKKLNRQTALITTVGTVLVVALLILGTIWTSRSAREDTIEAARSVSLLYLDELVGRREQVVEDNLNDNINIIRIAVSMIEPEDLSDLEHMRAYQRDMKQLFNLERFAFVDSDGLIYTADEGITEEIGQYSFRLETLAGPEISIKNLNTAEKKVIIAIPVREYGFRI